MKKVLFVGEHPMATTGNAQMLAGIVKQLDLKKYNPSFFCTFPATLDLILLSNNPFPFPIVNAKDNRDEWGQDKLVWLLRSNTFDMVVFVGIDIWRYAISLPHIKEMTDTGKMISLCIAPYDIAYKRKDWIYWFNCITNPYVYSKFAYDILKESVPNIKYFRPPLFLSELFRPLGDKKECKQRVFADMDPNTIVFGFVGCNQIRKDPQKTIKAFKKLKDKSDVDMTLFLHTDFAHGVYNLKQYTTDCEFKRGDIRTRREDQVFNREGMCAIYNSFDILLNCSYQEGLSWTPIEAGLCGIPAIVSDTTAHKELECEFVVPCNQEVYQPLYGEFGDTWMDSNSCTSEDIMEAMLSFINSTDEAKTALSEQALWRSKKWISECGNINSILDEVVVERTESVRILEDKIQNDILFVQHSSGGDVLMSTQCFKGLKERHKRKRLVYMTQKQFQGILKDNPYIDEIIDYNPEVIKKYAVVYNPHGEKILPGGWNNLDAKLYSMYPYFCGVEADKMFITCDRPIEKKSLLNAIDGKEYIVVNTSGGSEFRVYKHMEVVIANFKDKYPIVQVGGADDLYCKGAIDMRGKLTWTESAYVLKGAKAAVVIDCFCSHLVGALETPAVVLYGPAPARVVGPRYDDKTKVIEMEPDMLKVCPITSFCWSNPKVNSQTGRSKCISPCINSHNPITVRGNLNELIGRFS